jgi:hypothetical protein
MPLTVEPLDVASSEAEALKRWYGVTASPDGVKQTSSIPGEQTVFLRPQGLKGRSYMIAWSAGVGR